MRIRHQLQAKKNVSSLNGARDMYNGIRKIRNTVEKNLSNAVANFSGNKNEESSEFSELSSVVPEIGIEPIHSCERPD